MNTWLQLLRFGVAGVLNNLAGYLLYLGLTYLTPVGPKLAVTLLYPVGVAMSYAANRQWVFRSREGVQATLLRFVAVHALGYACNWLLLWALVDRLGWPHAGVQAGTILVVAALNFVLMRTVVFPQARTQEAAAQAARS